MKGFVSVHRKLMNNAVWTDPNYLKLLVDLCKAFNCNVGDLFYVDKAA